MHGRCKVRSRAPPNIFPVNITRATGSACSMSAPSSINSNPPSPIRYAANDATVSAESYSPPLTVHVFWSAEGSDPIRPQLGRRLYEFLSRPLDSNPAVDPGVGIPVRLGCHAAHVAASVAEALGDLSL